MRHLAIAFLFLLTFFLTGFSNNTKDLEEDKKTLPKGVTKVKDIVIYEDAQFHSAFPSVIKRPDGEIWVGFRRAPNRKIFGDGKTNHTDPNSYLVMVRSDDGENWSEKPELIYAHPYGGSQDPCMLQLKDGSVLCATYGWAFIRPEEMPNLKKPYFEAGKGTIFLGGYMMKMENDEESWGDVYYPPNIQPEINFSALGDPIPAYNRGAMYEGKNGDIYWIVAASDSNTPKKKTSNHLLISNDKGVTWKYSSVVAIDEKSSFNEASIYETPKGDLVGFLRTAGMDGQACIARSTDGGKSFNWEKMGFKGHPLNALRLPDDRVLVTYGYRHKPLGIRARILNSECTDFATAPEIVLRNDGGSTDIGYTWPVQLDENRVLVVYYFNKENGIRHIAGTILEIE